MRILISLVFIVLFTPRTRAQQEKNYILEINGDTVSASLGETIRYTTKDGKIVNLKVTKKELLSFDNGVVSFSYPSSFAISSTKVDEDVEQFLLMSAAGTGIMIQIYRSINPESVVDFLLSQIVEDDISAGYKETRKEIQKKLANGITMKGKNSILVMDNDKEDFSVLAYGKGKKGVTVVQLNTDDLSAEDQKLFDTFWKTFQIRY